MQNSIKLRQYRTSLHNKLKVIPDINNVEEERKRIKEATREAIIEVIQTQNRTPRNEWWDEECRQCIKRKKQNEMQMATIKNQKTPRTKLQNV
jgi:DNA primase